MGGLITDKSETLSATRKAVLQAATSRFAVRHHFQLERQRIRAISGTEFRKAKVQPKPEDFFEAQKMPIDISPARQTRRLYPILPGVIAAAVATAGVPVSARAQVTESVLHNFVNTDGVDPDSPLLADFSGKAGVPRALYGTTEGGGTSHSGTAYMLAAPKKGQQSWTLSTLWSFTGGKDGDKTDGAGLFAQTGKILPSTPLYGTTNGGAKGYGTVFSVAGSALTTIWTFKDDSNGSNPAGAMPVADASGALYIGTQTGGATGCGTVIQLVPPQPGQTSWTENTIWSFTGQQDGCHANGVIIDKSGVLTGTAVSGGATACDSGCGTVFQLTPPAAGQTAWTEQTLWQFQGYQSDGSAPLGTLTPGKKGVFYGVTRYGGDLGGNGSGNGAIYALTPPRKGHTQWTEQVVLNCGSASCPTIGGVIIDSAGALYGTSPFGGANSAGSVFKLVPPAKKNGSWNNTLLFSFDRATGMNGWVPLGPLTADKTGVLYGTTSIGGTGTCSGGNGCGVVFSVAGTGFAP